MSVLLRLTIRLLQLLQRLAPLRESKHLRTGRDGETEASFLLRQEGYCIVATNFRAPHIGGEIDLIAWDGDVLCFVEVKTRIGDTLLPPQAAVDAAKKDHIRSVARAYLRRLPGDRSPHCRFDIVSVWFAKEGATPELKLIKGAFGWKKHTPGPRAASFTTSRREPWRPRI